jgi:hypothetical protein
MNYKQKTELKAQQREHDLLVHRLRDEAVAMAAAEGIPIEDAIETVTGDVELRKAVRLVITWTPAKEAAAAEQKRIYEDQLYKLQGFLRPLIREADDLYCCGGPDEAMWGKRFVWLRLQVRWPSNELLQAADVGKEAMMAVIRGSLERTA